MLMMMVASVTCSYRVLQMSYHVWDADSARDQNLRVQVSATATHPATAIWPHRISEMSALSGDTDLFPET